MPYKSRKTKRVSLPSNCTPAFLLELDGRTELARYFKERFLTVANELGGLSKLSTLKRSLLERFLRIEAAIVRLESEIGKTKDVTVASDLLGRCLHMTTILASLAKTLGLELKDSATPWAIPLSDDDCEPHADGAGGVGDK